MGGVVEGAPCAPGTMRAVWASRITRKIFDNPIRRQECLSSLVLEASKNGQTKLTSAGAVAARVSYKIDRFASVKWLKLTRLTNDSAKIKLKLTTGNNLLLVWDAILRRCATIVPCGAKSFPRMTSREKNENRIAFSAEVIIFVFSGHGWE